MRTADIQGPGALQTGRKLSKASYARNQSEKVAPGHLTVYLFAYHRGRDRYRDRGRSQNQIR